MKKRSLLYLTLFTVFLLNSSAFADDTYVALYVRPQAVCAADGSYPGTSHARYLSDLESLINHLAAYTDINTIVFEMNQKTFHYQCDAGLAGLSYLSARGFDYDEAQRMASYARNANMKIIVATHVLSHLEFSAISEAYPQYMLDEGYWSSAGVFYTIRTDYVEHGGKVYECRLSHTSSAATEPGTAGGASCWAERNRSTRDPWNSAAETLTFSMINELITAFTLYGTKPDAFHIEADEAYSWTKVDLEDSANTENLDYAETYAMAINNLYNYIHDEIDSNMDVLIWGDTLDPLTNGVDFQTAAATEDIDKNIIIVDWRYDLATERYDFQTGLFPSVKEFTDKGFSVITASWMDPDATAALIWTGNMAEADGDTVLGHFYTTWESRLVPFLKYALEDPDDTALNVIPAASKEIILGVANSINDTGSLVGATQCAQNDTSYGTYPNCNNCNELDGIYGGNEYRDYYYDSGVTYDTIALPFDPVSYWDFEGNADDRMGNNDGTLCGNAVIATDSERGQVASFDGYNDYVSVVDDASLDMTDAFTISCWFKINDEIDDVNERMAVFGKYYTEYELQLYPKGRLFTFSSNGTAGQYEVGLTSYNPEVRNWETGKWYHTAWVMDGSTEYLYVNGELVGTGVTKDYNGVIAGTNALEIGRRSGGGCSFDGYIDDVMIFDEVLSPPEIKHLYLTQEMPAPIGYWDFEGDADDRVGDNDGTLYNLAYLDEDIERYNEEVLVLNGTTDYVTCGDPVEFRQTGSRTISAWIKPDATSSYRMIAGRYLWGSGLFILDGKLRGYIRTDGATEGNSISSTAIITTGEWQHVAMTFDIDGDKKIHLYRNGVEVSYSLQKTMVGNPDIVASRDFTIGVDYNLSRYYFDGKIDNVKLFDIALSPDQIAVQYQLGESLKLYDDLFEQNLLEESIRLDVDLDEGSGTTVYDDSDESNNGTIYGSNWAWVSGISGYAVDFYKTDADAYISFGTASSLNLTGSRSISAWVKYDSYTGDYDMIAGKFLWGSSIYVQDGVLKGYVSGTGGSASSHSSTAVVTTGEWQHVAMTFDIDSDPKVVRLYRNGEEVSYSYQTSFSGSSTDYSSMRFTVGADYTPRYHFDGKIDQVKVFNRALTPRQVIYYYLNSDI